MGFLEVVTSSENFGWVWNSRMPTQRMNVAIYDGDRLLGQTTANIFRPDLLSAKIGDGRYAFRFVMPKIMNDGKRHQLRVKVVGTEFEMMNSPNMYQGR